MAVNRFASRARQAGISQLETLGALAVGLLITVGSIALYAWYSDTQNETATADWLKAWSTGSAKYMSDNTAALIASSGGTFTLAQIAAAGSGYFPLGFSNSSPYGQTATLTVTLNGGQPQGLVCASGGISLSDLARKRIAGKVGISGGYSPSATPATIKGSQWGPVNLTSYGVAAGSCQLVAAQFVANATTMDDFLHRHNDGNPAHGQMNQNIDMTGNAIQNVSDVKMKAAGQGLTMFGGGERIVGTADYGISIQTNNGTERLKFANDGNTYFGGGANRIDPSGSIWLADQHSLLIGNGQFYSNNSGTMLLSSPVVNGTLYVRGGGVSNPWGAGNLDVGGNTNTNTLSANSVSIASGYNLHIGSNVLDGEGANGVWVLGQPNATFYVVGPGWSGANLAVNSTITAGGDINAGGNVNASGNVAANGRVRSGEYVEVDGAASAGSWCDSGNKTLIARSSDGSGKLMNCVNYVWRAMNVETGRYNYYMGSFTSTYNGWNGTDHTIGVTVYSSQNGSCFNNDFGALIYVNGALIARNLDYNQTNAKGQTSTVFVPPNTGYTVAPTNYQCVTASQIVEYR